MHYFCLSGSLENKVLDIHSVLLSSPGESKNIKNSNSFIEV